MFQNLVLDWNFILVMFMIWIREVGLVLGNSVSLTIHNAVFLVCKFGMIENYTNGVLKTDGKGNVSSVSEC